MTANAVFDGPRRARRAADAAVAAAENGEEEVADDHLFDVAPALSEVRDSLVRDDRAGYDGAAVAAIDPKALAGIDRANDAIPCGADTCERVQWRHNTPETPL